MQDRLWVESDVPLRRTPPLALGVLGEGQDPCSLAGEKVGYQAGQD